MGLSEIKELVSTAFQAGRMDAMFDMGVRSEKIRRKDAESYLASKGYKKNILDKWVDEHYIKEYVGDRANSPRYYSLGDINQMIVSSQIKRIL